MIKKTLLIFILNLLIVVLISALTDSNRHYTHEWAINIGGGEARARKIAEDYGFVYVDKIMEDYYLFRHNKVAKRSIFPSRYYHSQIAQDNRVLWLEQQVAKKRVKRYAEFNDPKWPKMWYLNRGNGLDMNVQKAWAMGVTGKGVAVTILDDGIEYKHPDLALNYDEKASYDVNNHDTDPTPRYEFTNENRHGTRCAGEVAAHANNSDCIVGVAYDAKIGGVRMLDGDVTDSVEAHSLSLNPQHIDIYSASWGPDDDGRTVDGPATLARKAFYDGITRGRGGLGSIFVWASGNGGRDDDNCNCDGYTNSIHTLSISSVTENGKIPWYSEACSSTLATTYSSGSTTESQIVTTDIRQSCTETHTGTSASAPLAAGLVALALQANPMLSWRDLQHIVVMTAKPDNLHDPTWTTNGVGRKVSHSFGYGLMDAAAMVQLARNWSSVPQQHICEVLSTDHNKVVPMNGKVSIPLKTDGCEGSNDHVKYIEHVQARITLKASRRGEIRISLKSPMGTTSTLLEKRSQDNSRDGFNNWAFMTTHNWGELSQGRWVLIVENGARSVKGARVKDFVLVLYGTDRNPLPPQTTTTSSTTPIPTTSSTTPVPTTDAKKSKRNPVDQYRPSDINNTIYMSEYYNNKIKKTRTKKVKKKPQRKNKKKKNKYKYGKNKSSYGRNFHQNSKHMCQFETLAKQNEYYQNMMSKKDLSSADTFKRRACIEVPPSAAELVEWTLVVTGTPTHPQARDIAPPQNKPFQCSGTDSQGICIECQPGYYKLKDGCVKNCPKHYYGTMQVVNIRSTFNSSASRTRVQRQGLCNQCHEACRNCKGPHVTDCFQCKDGYEKRDDICQKKLLLNFLDPDMLGFFVWVIVLCIAAIVLFGVIFGLLQARDRRLLCWKGKVHLDKGKCEYNGMTLTREEIENDLENFDIIRNRNFRHASLPESQDPVCRVLINNFEIDRQNRLNQVKYDNKQYSSNSLVGDLNNASGYNPVSSSVQLQSSVPGQPSDSHRKAASRSSLEKSTGRKHTDSYVSYDISGTLTRTLGSDVYHQVNRSSNKNSSSNSSSRSHRHPGHHHSGRTSASSRH